MSDITLNLSKTELSALVSALLFTSSVNIVGNCTSVFNEELVNLAVRLKKLHPSMKLDGISFIKEDYYEEKWSENILHEFISNLNVITLDQV